MGPILGTNQRGLSIWTLWGGDQISLIWGFDRASTDSDPQGREYTALNISLHGMLRRKGAGLLVPDPTDTGAHPNVVELGEKAATRRPIG